MMKTRTFAKIVSEVKDLVSYTLNTLLDGRTTEYPTLETSLRNT